MTLAVLFALLAAVEPIQRSEVLARGQGGLGFSYYWGHGSWLPGHAGDAAGSCTGSCPNCTHTGRYGADCSGFVCKAWAMPASNSDVTVDSHPYSTADLINSKPGYWTPVTDAQARPGDARVYRSNGSGHTYLIRDVTGAGRFTTYEAKGCSYGILSTARTDAWTTQRRASIVEPQGGPPSTPEVPAGPISAPAGQLVSFCTRATAPQGGNVVDSIVVRDAGGKIVSTTDAPAALSGAEMCIRVAFPAPGRYAVTARARNDVGVSAESAALAVTVTGAADAGVADAGTPDAGVPDAGEPDAGPDDGDGPGIPPAAKGCGGCGGGGQAAVVLIGLVALRRRRK